MQTRNKAEHKSTREQIVGLRRAVVEYHSAVLGHGALISDPEARARRIEEKIGLSDAWLKGGQIPSSARRPLYMEPRAN